MSEDKFPAGSQESRFTRRRSLATTVSVEVSGWVRTIVLSCLVLAVAALFPSSLPAQVAEINPYVGFYWPNQTDGFGTFQSNQLLGVRGGYYLTPGFELGGNYSWSSHFQPNKSNALSKVAGDLGFPQGKVRANIWELEFSYNFGKRNLFGSTALKPYVVIGTGGLTTSTKDPSTFVLNVRPVVTPSGDIGYVENTALGSSETFFTFSYGGGLKAERLWGRMGVFADVRGRLVPNFIGNTMSWPEVSTGLTFSWGEK